MALSYREHLEKASRDIEQAPLVWKNGSRGSGKTSTENATVAFRFEER
jgi:hypothetical protein